MAIIGTAYVQVRAITDKINGDIQKSLTAQTGAFQKAGNDYSAAIKRGLAEGAVDLSGFKPNMDTSEIEAGNDRIRESSSRAAKDTEGLWSRAGRNSGGNFITNFGEGNISAHIKRLFYQMLFGTPVVAALGAALSSLVSGLFAVGSAVAPAANALAVLPGLASAALSGILALAIGFKGVGAAFKAGSKAATAGVGGVGGAAKQAVKTVATAFRSIPSEPFKINWELPEQRAVRDTYEQTAEAVANAVKAVNSAESGLASALKASRDAQQAVIDARAEAIDQLIELGFAAEQAAISEGKAAIALERAQEKYALVAELPPNHRLRREAELNLQQAQLDLEEATKKNKDSATEQANAASKGVEGSDAVVQARQDEVEATNAAADAQSNYAKAQIELEKTLRSQVEQNADAQKNLADALKGTASAGGAAAKAQDAFAAAMAKLSPEAREFVQALLDSRDAFKQVQNAAGEKLFPQLTAALGTLVGGGFLTIFADSLRIAGDAVGGIAVKLVALTSNPFFTGNFVAVSEANAGVLRGFGDIITNLVSLFFALANAAAPITQMFVDWAVSLTGNWLASATNDFGGLTAKITEGSDVVRQVSRIFSLLWDSIKLIGAASQESGQSLIDSFEGALETLKEFLSTPEQQQTMKQYFQDVADNVRSLSDLIVGLTSEFIKLGDNPTVAKIADQFASLAPAIGNLLDESLTNVGPVMADLVSQLIELFETFSAGGGGLKTYISILNEFITTINDLNLGPLVAGLGTAFAAYKAFSLIAQPFRSIITGGISLVSTTKAMVDGFRGVESAATRANAGSAAFGESMKGIGSKIKGGLSAMKSFAVETAKATANLAKQGAMAAVTGVKIAAQTTATIAATAAEKIATAAKIAGAAASRLLGIAVTLATGPIGLVIIAITALVAGFVWLWNNVDGFRNFFIGAWAAIQTAVSAVVDWVKANWPLLLAIITGPIGLAVKFVIDHWDQIKSVVATAIDWILNYVQSVLQLLLTIWNNIWNGISAAGQAVWNAIVTAATWYFNLVKSIIVGVISGLSSAWNAIWGGIRDTAVGIWNGIVAFFQDAVGTFGTIFGNIAGGIAGPFRSAFNSIAGFWNETIGAMTWTVPDWVPALGGKTISAPKLPRLALGGTVKATTGGVAAIIGEAGRDERVTPLNANGMSPAEQTMTDLLRALTQGPRQVVIQVYAAPGMDISTLAKQVSRELAFLS